MNGESCGKIFNFYGYVIPNITHSSFHLEVAPRKRKSTQSSWIRYSKQ